MSKGRRSAPESANGAALRMARLSVTSKLSSAGERQRRGFANGAAERHYLTRENKVYEQRKKEQR